MSAATVIDERVDIADVDLTKTPVCENPRGCERTAVGRLIADHKVGGRCAMWLLCGPCSIKERLRYADHPHRLGCPAHGVLIYLWWKPL